MLDISNHSVADKLKKYKLYSIETLSSKRTGRVLARWIGSIALLMLVILFLPWQQNITGYGKMTALDPGERPQTVQSAIPGRIMDWRVKEGQFVHKGDTLLVLAEIKDDYFDPELLLRTREQIEAKKNGIAATQNQIQFTDKQLAALRDGLRLKLQQSRNKLAQSRLKVISDSADLANEKVQYEIAQKQFSRFEELYTKTGQISLTELEIRRQRLQAGYAKLISAQNKLDIARADFINARVELGSVEAEYGDKINKAETELNAKVSYMAEATAELAKLRNKYANLEVRVSNYHLLAPQDGFVVRALKAGIGETIKEGEAVVTIQPDLNTIAAEIYVRPMDVPLLSRGRKVRLQFDGWPSIQISGWPSVSVGTFGGEVKVIDFVNSIDGNFRVLITPDKSDEAWPTQLRLGSGVYGWVMLDDVPIWFEIWRQLNGFPPSLYKQPEDYKASVVKDAEKKDKK